VDAGHAALEDFLSKKGTKNRVGECAYNYVEALRSRFERDFQEETAKAALQNAWTTGVLKIVPGTLKKGESGYSKTAVENGDVVITVYDYCNVGDTGNGLLATLGDNSTGLPVKAVQNMKENEEKRNEGLAAIQAATQLACEVTLDCDVPTFGAKTSDINRVGDTIQYYVEAMQSYFERHFKEDEIARNALQAAWTTGVFKLEFGTKKKGQSGYAETNIRDGDLVVTVFEVCNVSDTGRDLLDKLGDPNSGLSLKAAQNMKQNEEKRTEGLERIHTATQLACDVTLDCDVPTFSSKLSDKDRVGDVIQYYIDAMGSRTERLFKEDETARNALQAVWTTGVLRVEYGTKKKGQSGYAETNIRDGDLVVTVFEVCNVDDTGSDLMDKLGDPNSGLPLKAAINVKENEGKKTENLEAIKETVGLATDCTFDIDWAVIHPFCVKNGYADRCGEVVYDYILTGLKDRLVRICQEELTKEAIAENWSTGVLRLEAGPPKMSGYHTVDFADGDLVIKFRPDSMCTNVSDIGSDIEGKL